MLAAYTLLTVTLGAIAPVPATATVETRPALQPSPAPVSWQLDFEHTHPRRMVVQVPGESEPRVYWYLLYTVTNPTPRTVNFFPIFELLTDDLTVTPTDMGVPKIVFDAIRERHRRTHPDLVSPAEAIGPLRTGADDARESVAIWRAAEVRGNAFTVFVEGLSGETQFLANPAGQASDQSPEEANSDESDTPQRFTLRKTLMLSYGLPGSPRGRANIQAIPRNQRWIMR